MKLKILCILSFLLPVISIANTVEENQTNSKTIYQPVQVKAGMHLGWDFPYATGLEASVLLHELVDFNTGASIGMSGAKVGFGVRAYPLRKPRVSPLVGCYYYRNSGINRLNVNVNYDYAVYRIPANSAILLNAGIRIRLGKGHYILTSMGNSIPLAHRRAKYISGSTSSSVRNFANSFVLGGFSFNVGFLLKLNSGYYRT